MATVMSKARSLFDSDADEQVQMFGLRRGFAHRRRGTAQRGRPGAAALRPARVVCLGLVVAWPCLTAVPGLASQSPLGQPASAADASPSTHNAPEQDPFAQHVEQNMAQRRNLERQKTLVADTDKLLALAQQLKADVDKSNKNVLSLDVVKRAEQIEKLARSVKEKMRGN